MNNHCKNNPLSDEKNNPPCVSVSSVQRRAGDFSISKIRKFRYFDVWKTFNLDEMPSVDIARIPGVYVFIVDGVVSYIGQTNNVKDRLSRHGINTLNKKLFNKYGMFKEFLIKIKFSSKIGKEAMIEKRLILRLKPRINKNYLKMRKEPCF